MNHQPRKPNKHKQVSTGLTDHSVTPDGTDCAFICTMRPSSQYRGRQSQRILTLPGPQTVCPMMLASAYPALCSFCTQSSALSCGNDANRPPPADPPTFNTVLLHAAECKTVLCISGVQAAFSGLQSSRLGQFRSCGCFCALHVHCR